MIKRAVSKGPNLAKFRSKLPAGGVFAGGLPSTPNVTKIHPLAKQKFGSYTNVLGQRGK
jgi:hypothetical protein